MKDLFRNVTNSRTIIVLFVWNISRIFYPKTIGTLFSLLVTDIVLSTLHYEIMEQFIYNQPHINTIGYLKRYDKNYMFINSSLLCILYYCTFYYPLWLVIVFTPLIEIYNPRYVVYKPDILLLLSYHSLVYIIIISSFLYNLCIYNCNVIPMKYLVI